MRIGQDVLGDSRAALAMEWLLGNGLGGSASGTVSGAHTRTTHAHLVVAGPHGRLTTVLLKLGERLASPDGTFELGGSVPATGAARAAGSGPPEEFRLDPWPVWRHAAAGVLIEKSLFLICGHNAVAVAYRQLRGPEVRLTLSPLMVARDPGATQREVAGARGAVHGVPGRVRIEMVPGGPGLTLWHNGAFLPARAWQRVRREAADPAGNPAADEDAFVAGYIEASLSPGGALYLIASAEDDLLRTLAQEDRLGVPPPRTLAECMSALEADERERVGTSRQAAAAASALTRRQARAARRGATEEQRDGASPAETPDADPARAETTDADAARADESDPWIERLGDALRLGIVRRGHRLILLSSLPSAVERPADCLRALAGLVAVRGFETTRQILRGYVEYLDEGLAPEGFDQQDGSPRYGDAAPALWLVFAAALYARRSQDLELMKESVYPALEEVMHFYRSGTRHGIHVDEDGLLVTGEGSRAVKPAGLNVLWYHATVAMTHLARSIGRKANGAFFLAWAHEHQKRFNQVLWDETRACLYRGLAARGPVRGLEASQVLALSLYPPLLPAERAAKLAATIERELFTPFGLRPTPDADTVATEWLGAFYTGYLRAHSRSDEARERVHAWLELLRRRLDPGVPAHVPEAFMDGKDAQGDAAPARGPDGTFSPLAAAELLRAWIEDLDPAEAPAAEVQAPA